MPRMPRSLLGGVPAHVVHRGNNRSACFYSDEDYAAYMAFANEAASKERVEVHAFVLMTNHIHWLLTGETNGSISYFMQRLGRSYVQYANKTYRRTGTMWEGRFKASLVESDKYLLSCYRYIELNPVRANMVDHPSEYRWSSYHANALGTQIKIIKPHSIYLALGQANSERQLAYRELFSSALDADEVNLIRSCIETNQITGKSRFIDEIENSLGRRVKHRQRGRKAKAILAKNGN